MFHSWRRTSVHDVDCRGRWLLKNTSEPGSNTVDSKSADTSSGLRVKTGNTHCQRLESCVTVSDQQSAVIEDGRYNVACACEGSGLWQSIPTLLDRSSHPEEVVALLCPLGPTRSQSPPTRPWLEDHPASL